MIHPKEALIFIVVWILIVIITAYVKSGLQVITL